MLKVLSLKNRNERVRADELRLFRAEAAAQLFAPDNFEFLSVSDIFEILPADDFESLPADFQRLIHEIRIYRDRDSKRLLQYAQFLKTSSRPEGDGYANALIIEARRRQGGYQHRLKKHSDAVDKKDVHVAHLARDNSPSLSNSSLLNVASAYTAFLNLINALEYAQSGVIHVDDVDDVDNVGDIGSALEMLLAHEMMLETNPSRLRECLRAINDGLEIHPILSFACWEQQLQIGNRSSSDLEDYSAHLSYFGPDWRAYAESLKAEAAAKK